MMRNWHTRESLWSQGVHEKSIKAKLCKLNEQNFWKFSYIKVKSHCSILNVLVSIYPLLLMCYLSVDSTNFMEYVLHAKYLC